ncbi:hypothetical protein B0H66DRAFT_186688 [Apodospora peruviana]|uniref:Uncharacterized protein n=1 Tax=Apodospora peruviana TaxID=516989 RepID=A0AAE0M7D5_9PEZI|nr:hypothetical protein B0H66DRAFT_186688 [Apodospora peruviana]
MEPSHVYARQCDALNSSGLLACSPSVEPFILAVGFLFDSTPPAVSLIAFRFKPSPFLGCCSVYCCAYTLLSKFLVNLLY